MVYKLFIFLLIFSSNLYCSENGQRNRNNLTIVQFALTKEQEEQYLKEIHIHEKQEEFLEEKRKNLEDFQKNLPILGMRGNDAQKEFLRICNTVPYFKDPLKIDDTFVPYETTTKQFLKYCSSLPIFKSETIDDFAIIVANMLLILSIHKEENQTFSKRYIDSMNDSFMKSKENPTDQSKQAFMSAVNIAATNFKNYIIMMFPPKK